MTITKELLEAEGYMQIEQLPTGVWAGLQDMIYTTGLFVGLDETGYRRRYCYPSYESAVVALRSWDGQDDPPGPWIKRKGLGEDKIGPCGPEVSMKIDLPSPACQVHVELLAVCGDRCKLRISCSTSSAQVETVEELMVGDEARVEVPRTVTLVSG